MSAKITVVGGGVIGLSVAWRLASSGRQVTVLDPAPTTGASWVAGGMLAPVSEAWPGEEQLLDLGSASLAAWPAFAAELADPGLRTDGTVVAALDTADAAELDTLAKHLASRGREVERLTGRELRALEPSLSSTVRSGLLVPGDLAVDNRELLRSLRKACAEHGVVFVHASATKVHPGAITLDNEYTMDCDVAVIAAGAWSCGLHPALATLIHPVKGEILRLRARQGALPLPGRTIRAVVESRPIYLVPRRTGELVLGATQYEAGFNTEVTVRGVHDLLSDADRLLPGIGEYALVECAAGLRAGSRDNLPLIGWLEPGVLAATGHHRNGFLLAPITAAAIEALLDGGPHPAPATDPARFADSTRVRCHG
jgi:glycine oxidase